MSDSSLVTSVNSVFGAKLRELRKTSGLTQADLGDAVHLSRTAITNIESGNQGVTLEVLYLFAEALKAQPADLLPTNAEMLGGTLAIKVRGLVSNPLDQAALINALISTKRG